MSELPGMWEEADLVGGWADTDPDPLADVGIMERLTWWAERDRRPQECADDLLEAARLMKRWRNLALYYRNANKEMAAVIGGEQE